MHRDASSFKVGEIYVKSASLPYVPNDIDEYSQEKWIFILFLFKYAKNSWIQGIISKLNLLGVIFLLPVNSKKVDENATHYFYNYIIRKYYYMYIYYLAYFSLQFSNKHYKKTIKWRKIMQWISAYQPSRDPISPTCWKLKWLIKTRKERDW